MTLYCLEKLILFWWETLIRLLVLRTLKLWATRLYLTTNILANDSLTYMDVGYIGSIPEVASNDTICSTDPFGVLYAEPFDGLTFGWYASPTDTVATATGDSFVVAKPRSTNMVFRL